MRKLLCPWTGPFSINEKVSPIPVRLRRKFDGKLVHNKAHINRLKHGYIGMDGPDDPSPPNNATVIEPAILSETELPSDNFCDLQPEDIQHLLCLTHLELKPKDLQTLPGTVFLYGQCLLS
ncbi:hypothetical protein EOD39_1469 [Acipenser ruthenus]|uniref:Uncharacterized protein n=1 Tax=Acipenser ruthenus TaxID=7906 RepID=A0A444UB66_ACIRT|nr:hypothetical protein EOD39_1469 [Acipenser ruthenus]